MNTKRALYFLIVLVLGFAGIIVAMKVSPRVKAIVENIIGPSGRKKPRIDYEVSPAKLEKPDKLGENPSFKLQDQNGLAFDSKEMLGTIWLVNFMHSQDKGDTPAQLASIKYVNERLSKYPLWNDLSFLSITVDPVHDQPNVLKDYAAENDFSSDNWKFLTGSESAIKELSEEGFDRPIKKVIDEGKALIEFSQDLILIDRKGNIRGYYDHQETDKLLKDIAAVIVETEGKMVFPETAITPLWLDDRKEQQLGTLDEFKVFHDFQYTDITDSSGITFRHQVTGAGGKKFVPVHYDHGNGMAIADVDQDGLYDVFLISQVGENQLWRNVGDGKFVNITANSGLRMEDVVSVSVSFADIDNDDDPDVYITTVRDGNRLFENNGKGEFKDISKAANVDYKGHSSGTVFFDYNNDGLLDLFVANIGKYTSEDKEKMTVSNPYNSSQDGNYTYYKPVEKAFSLHLLPEMSEMSVLYKNLGENKFEDVTKGSGIDDLGWNGDASPVDLNSDGFMDLYVTNMQGEDHYYENIEGQRFEDKTKTYFPKTSWGAMGIKAFDYNNDSHMDIYVTDMHSDMSKYKDIKGDLTLEKKKGVAFFSFLQTKDTIMGNSFFENQGNGQFEEASSKVNAENFWPWGISTGDLNADGYEDAFLASSMNYRFRYAVNSVMLNNKGEKFLDSEFILGVEPRLKGRSAQYWFTLDCSTVDKDHKYCNNKQGLYEVWGTTGTRTSVIFDLDNDGDLDILTGEYNAEPRVLVSNLESSTTHLNFIKIKLRGTTSNRDGLGAKITLKTANLTQTKVNDGKSGYLSQSSYPLYFGLDNDQEILEIKIVWPGGKEQIINKNIPLNDLLVIEEL